MAPLCEACYCWEVELFQMWLELLLVLLDLVLALFKAQAGYLHFCSACLRWSFSFLSNRALEKTVLAVCQGVNDTKHGSHIAMTVPLRVQICLHGISVHNCDEGVVRLWHHQSIQGRNEPNSSFFDISVTTKVSSIYFFHILGGSLAVLMVLISKSCM